MKSVLFTIAVVILSGCAKTTVTQLSANQFLLSTSAAPACGRSGAVEVAGKMAAVETLRRGYTHFIILGAGSESNVSTITTGPTYATTTGTYNRFGNSISGNSTTTFGGQQTMIVGSNDADLRVLMLRRGDPYFSQGVDARAQLGPEWRSLVEEGIKTCT